MTRRLLVTVTISLLILLAWGARPAAAQVSYYPISVIPGSGCDGPFVHGTVLDEMGRPLVGVQVSGWFLAPDGSSYPFESRVMSGSAPQYGPGGWVLYPTGARAPAGLPPVSILRGTFYVAVGTYFEPLSVPEGVQLHDSCNDSSQPNQYAITFRRSLTDPAEPYYPPGTSAAPEIEANARCRTFTQTTGAIQGFRVCDDSNARFLSAFERYGLQTVGYPISRRYVKDGFVVQAFQKAILQWDRNGNQVAFVNIFDEMHDAGFDGALLAYRQTPPQLPAGWDGDNLPYTVVLKRRLALLDERPALRAAYNSVRDPMVQFGLPTSEVTDMGNHYAIRLQRAVLQEWKQDVPWARAGEVTIANGGDIAKELGHLPLPALFP